MEKFLLDSNIIISLLKHGSHLERILTLGRGAVAISRINHYEIYVGIERSPNQNARKRKLQHFEQLLELVTILELDQAASLAAAKINAQLQSLGTPIGPMDTLIAGIAIANNHIIVTNNTREFARVPELQTLSWDEQ